MTSVDLLPTALGYTHATAVLTQDAHAGWLAVLGIKECNV
jgi:hypothetical protein